MAGWWFQEKRGGRNRDGSRRASSSGVDNSIGQNGIPSHIQREAAMPGKFKDLSLLSFETFLCLVSCCHMIDVKGLALSPD